MRLTITVNGVARHLQCDPRDLLLQVLREDLGLRGTKYGCGEGRCGACTVVVDGRVVTACLMTAGQAHGVEVTTIEAMVGDDIGRRLLDAFVEAGAVQCGFCTPGFVLAARSLLVQDPAPAADRIRDALDGNLCRCTGYARIVEAVARAAPGVATGSARGPVTAASTVRHKRYVRPATLDEALESLAAARSGWHVLAGGTDLFTRYEHHLRKLDLLDLGGLTELRGIREVGDVIHVGALTRMTDVAGSPVLRRWAPALVTAARGVGGVQIRNQGTIGGNLANASPAADSVPPLSVSDARLVLRSRRGQRTVSVLDFATGPGRTVLAKDELLVGIEIPKRRAFDGQIMFFEKVGQRRAQTVAIASVALCGRLDNGRWHDVRMAMGGVGPTVMSAPRAAATLSSGPFDEVLLRRAAASAALECEPIDDIRSSAIHRRRLVEGLLIRNLLPFAIGS